MGAKGKSGADLWCGRYRLARITNWAAKGCTMAEIAHNMGVSPKTLYAWRAKRPEIAEAIDHGRELSIVAVENAAFMSAVGESYEESEVTEVHEDPRGGKTRHVRKVRTKKAPSTSAQIFILKNRAGYSDNPVGADGPDGGLPSGSDEVPPADFGLLVAPPFLAPHRAVATDAGGDFWEYGGRFSGKSSHISLEVADGMRRHQDRSAYVVMRQRQDMRESVYEQMLWALSELGMDGWEGTVSPLKITNPATGQVVIFHGCDRADKTKAVKAPAGQYFAYQWFEEVDQLRGMDEVRTVQQSVTRGPGPFFRFYGFNPPRSRDAWANGEIARREAAGLPVYRSSYLDMPPEWVPDQVRADADALRAANPDAYRHEWLGEATGYGNEVFGNVEVREVTASERAAVDRHYYGVDWGFAADPWCWVMVGYVPNTRTLYVLDEMSGHGLSNAETARMVRERMAKSALDEAGNVVEDAEPWAPVACDSAEPKSVADYRSEGINAQGAPKTGPHNVRNSVRWLQDRARIVVDPRCALAASEFPNWKYETTRDGRATGTVEDRDNHAVDAVRYACSTLIADRSCV